MWYLRSEEAGQEWVVLAWGVKVGEGVGEDEVEAEVDTYVCAERGWTI